MLYFDPPRIKRSLGQAALREPYPSWLLDAYGVVQSANLMAFWLWDKLGHTEAIRPDLLIGRNIFAIQAENFERIPLFRNIEFYTKWSALVKSAAAKETSSPYASLIAKMKTDPHRATIYEGAISSPEHVWEHRLLITIPANDELLELGVTLYRLENEAGFLAMTNPVAAALPIVEEQYSRLIAQYGEKAYIHSEQEKPGENRGSFFSNFPAYYRVYYPTMIQDPLWYIIEENKAQQLLLGASAVGMHFFELFFAPQLRPWLGPLQENSGPRAMKYFERFTIPFRQEEHELHTAYTHVVQRLLQLPEYRQLMELSWKFPIHLNLPTDEDTPFYSCRVFLPWTLAPEITLQFRSMVRFLYKGLLITKDQHYYEETLIPENYETEVALLLLYLSSGLNENMHTLFKQLLWGLALLKTVLEGLGNLEGGDAHWEPEAAFGRTYRDIESEMHMEGEEMKEALTAEWRKSLRDFRGKMDREMLFSFLKIVATRNSLEHFSAFLAQEWERIQTEGDGASINITPFPDISC